VSQPPEPLTEHTIRTLIDQLHAGALAPEAAVARLVRGLRDAPFEDVGFARIDHHRPLRQGWPEVVFGQGKTADQIAEIARRIVANGHNLLVTRVSAPVWEQVRSSVPDAVFHDTAQTIVLTRMPQTRLAGTVLVCCAGTSDLRVAEEAAVSADALHLQVDRLYDVGVAGLHRLLHARHQLAEAAVVIVVAGMEGALPSVVGGLTPAPVIAVPTSVGYGASFGGVAALLAMLNSCAAGVGVMNIDNGFGAAALARRILQSRREPAAPR
jgi:NCAIR mutase (PurE)-related protein